MKAQPTVIHIGKSHKSPYANQNLPKSMPAQRTVDTTLQQIDRKIIEDKEHQALIE